MLRNVMAVLVATAVVAVLPAQSAADSAERGVGDVTKVESRDGFARIYFKLDEPLQLQDTSVRRAKLTIPCRGEVVSDGHQVRLYAVSRAWNPGGLDWEDRKVHAQLYSDADVRLSRTEGKIEVDITNLIKETAERGEPSLGFMLSTPPGKARGLSGKLLRRLGNLEEAKVTVNYRKLPVRTARS